MESLRRAMHAERAEQESSTDGERHGSKPLMRARRALKAALADQRDGSPDEQARIADILQRAADEISRKTP